MDIHELDNLLLIGSAVLIAAVLAVRVSVFAGLPSLLAYLGLGLLLGDSGAGIEFADADLALALGFAALVLILAEGGLTTPWDDVRPSLGLGLVLATLGSVVSVAVVALGAHYLLDLRWELAVLLAAVLTPTDAAAVFSVLRTVPLRKAVTGTLEVESGLNDAPIVVLVIAISAGDIQSDGPWAFTGLIVFELIVGAAMGLLVGFGAARLLRNLALPASGLYPLVVISFTVLAYGAAAFVHASGFAAVYLAALVLGNTELPHRRATRSFVEGIGWLAQIALFVMLGLLASPDSFESWHVWTGLAAGAILTFVARPLSIAISAVLFSRPWREQVFLGWAGIARGRADHPRHHPARRRRGGIGRPVQHRLRGGRRLHARAGCSARPSRRLVRCPDRRSPRHRGRGCAAGTHLRRPPAGAGAAGIEARRGGDRRAPPARRRIGDAGGARRQAVRATSHHAPEAG